MGEKNRDKVSESECIKKEIEGQERRKAKEGQREKANKSEND